MDDSRFAPVGATDRMAAEGTSLGSGGGPPYFLNRDDRAAPPVIETDGGCDDSTVTFRRSTDPGRVNGNEKVESGHTGEVEMAVAVEKYLSYTGIRVTDLDRSLKFYTELFGLTEVARGDLSQRGRGSFVLLQDPWSGQKLELNWYPPDSPYAVPYLPGEGLDHISFRVADLRPFLDQLRRSGAESAGGSADFEDPNRVRVAFVKDPDEHWICLIELINKPIPASPGKGK